MPPRQGAPEHVPGSREQVRRGAWAQGLAVAIVLGASVAAAWSAVGATVGETESPSAGTPAQNLTVVGGSQNACRCSLRIEPED